MAAAVTAPNNRIKKITFENCAPFTDCIAEINNMQIANAKNIAVMSMYSLIEHCDNYSRNIRKFMAILQR